MAFTAKAGELFVELTARDSQLRAGIARGIRSLRPLHDAMIRASRVARNLLIGGAGMGIMAIKTAADFEQGMARVGALTGATGKVFDALKAQARDLGETTVFTARQAADAMGYFALAGFNAQKIMAAMPDTLNLAAAGQMDVATSANIVAKVMAGMGLEAEELTHAVDVLTKAFTSSNTNLVQLGDAMKYVGPVGKAAGKSIEELTASIQVMSNAGIQGTMAGSSLRRIISALLKPSKQAQKIIDKMGVTVVDASTGMLKTMPDVIDEINKGFLNLSGGAERAGAIMEIFGLRGGPAMAALLAEGGEALRIMQRILKDSAGVAADIASRQLDTLRGSLTVLRSAVEGLAIRIGNQLIPTIRRWAEHLISVAEIIKNMSAREFVAILEKIKTVGKWLIGIWLAPKLLSSIFYFVSLLKMVKLNLMALNVVRVIGLGMTSALVGSFALIGIAAAGLAMQFAKVKAEMISLQIKSTTLMRHLKELNKLLYPKKIVAGEELIPEGTSAALRKAEAAVEAQKKIMKGFDITVMKGLEAGPTKGFLKTYEEMPSIFQVIASLFGGEKRVIDESRKAIQKTDEMHLAYLEKTRDKLKDIANAEAKERWLRMQADKKRLEQLKQQREEKMKGLNITALESDIETKTARARIIGLTDLWTMLQENVLSPATKEESDRQKMMDTMTKTLEVQQEIKEIDEQELELTQKIADYTMSE